MGASYGVSKQASRSSIKLKDPVGTTGSPLEVTNKWQAMIRSCRRSEHPLHAYRSNPKRTGKFFRQVKLGPPAAYRWDAWQAVLGLAPADTAAYQRLPCDHTPAAAEIQKDVDRTFPEEPFFAAPQGQQMLGRVLAKLAVRCPEVGYCQSMNYIAGFLLLVSRGAEAQVLEVMEQLLRDFGLAGFYQEDMQYVKQCLWVLQQLLGLRFPELSKYLEEKGVSLDVWVLKWFLTAFTADFGKEVAVRVWDYFLIDKTKTLIQTALGILGHFQSHLLKQDLAGLFLFFKRPQRLFQNPEQVVKLLVEAHVSYSELTRLERMYQIKHGKRTRTLDLNEGDKCVPIVERHASL